MFSFSHFMFHLLQLSFTISFAAEKEIIKVQNFNNCYYTKLKEHEICVNQTHSSMFVYDIEYDKCVKVKCCDDNSKKTQSLGLFSLKKCLKVLRMKRNVILERKKRDIQKFVLIDEYGRSYDQYPKKEYDISADPNAKYEQYLPEIMRSKYIGKQRTEVVMTDVCAQLPDSGHYCTGVLGDKPPLFVRYYFDSHSQSCLCMFYNGCDGNANNFKSIKHCDQWCITKPTTTTTTSTTTTTTTTTTSTTSTSTPSSTTSTTRTGTQTRTTTPTTVSSLSVMPTTMNSSSNANADSLVNKLKFRQIMSSFNSYVCTYFF